MLPVEALAKFQDQVLGDWWDRHYGWSRKKSQKSFYAKLHIKDFNRLQSGIP